MTQFIEITTVEATLTLAVNTITRVESNDDDKAVIYTTRGSVPYVTDTETYATFIARLP